MDCHSFLSTSEKEVSWPHRHHQPRRMQLLEACGADLTLTGAQQKVHAKQGIWGRNNRVAHAIKK